MANSIHHITNSKKTEIKFFNYFRMCAGSFYELLCHKNSVMRKNTNMRCGTALQVKLYNLPVWQFEKQWRTDSYLLLTKEKNRSIVEGFNKHANFPNCVGAVDGKLIRTEKPGQSGSLYFNYKHYCSVVLLAAADSNFRFVYADAGPYGRLWCQYLQELFLVAKTSAQVITDACQTICCVNSSSARHSLWRPL
jgi:hypothetical protein